MTTAACGRNRFGLGVLALSLVGLASIDVRTQVPVTAPTPNFELTFHPELMFNLWPADFNRDSRRRSGRRPVEQQLLAARRD